MNTLRVLVQDIQQLGSGAARTAQTVLPFGQGREADAEHLRKGFLGHAVQLPEESDFAAHIARAEAGGAHENGPGFREGEPLCQRVLHIELRAFLKIRSDLLRGIAVCAVAADIGQGADIAAVLVTPSDDARVAPS